MLPYRCRSKVDFVCNLQNNKIIFVERPQIDYGLNKVELYLDSKFHHSQKQKSYLLVVRLLQALVKYNFFGNFQPSKYHPLNNLADLQPLHK